MLKFNLKTYLQLRNVNKPRTFLINLGIYHGTARKILSGEMDTLQLRHLENICRALRCTPNDILEWMPDPQRPVDESHPLYQLASNKNLNRLLEKIGKLSVEELERLVGEE